MPRKTRYHKNLVTKEKLENVLRDNLLLLEGFLRYCEASDKSRQTVYQYKKQLEMFFVWNAYSNGNIFFTEIKKKNFVSFFRYLNEELEASPNRVASFRAVLSSFSNYIERTLDDEHSSFRNCIVSLESVRRQPIRQKTILSETMYRIMVEQLLEEEEYQLACFVSLLASSGMRRSEIMQVRVTDFVGEGRVVFGCLYETGFMRTKGPGRAGKVLTRYVFKESFDEYFNLWMEKREELGIESDFLFVRKQKGKWEPILNTTINSWCKKIERITGIPFYPHSMRHYFVTAMKRKGYPDEIIQKIVKWSSVNMVETYNDLGDYEILESFFAHMQNQNNTKI